MRGKRAQVAIHIGQARKAVQVPLWVAFPCHTSSISLQQDWELHGGHPSGSRLPLQSVACRTQVVPEGRRRASLGRGLLRHNIQNTGFPEERVKRHPWCRRGGLCPCTWSSRCSVPAGLFFVHSKIVEAIAAVKRLLGSLVSEMKKVFLSGINNDMRLLLEAMSGCWQWSLLVSEQPTKDQCLHFLKCREMLKFSLKFTLWPPAALGFVAVADRHWNLSNRALVLQYLRLCQRVRAVARAAQSSDPRQRRKYPAELLEARTLDATAALFSKELMLVSSFGSSWSLPKPQKL